MTTEDKAEIDRLRAENERLYKLKTPASRKLLNITKAFLDHAEAENARLKAALQACIKSAEADGDLKESGWWDEQSIIAIENARKELADQGKG